MNRGPSLAFDHQNGSPIRIVTIPDDFPDEGHIRIQSCADDRRQQFIVCGIAIVAVRFRLGMIQKLGRVEVLAKLSLHAAQLVHGVLVEEVSAGEIWEVSIGQLTPLVDHVC